VPTASYGGKYDNLIEKHNLRYAKVVYSEDEATRLHLEIDHDDSHAMSHGASFALLLHGTQPAGTVAAKTSESVDGLSKNTVANAAAQKAAEEATKKASESSKAAAKALADEAKELRRVEEAAQKYALELEKLASSERIKALEFRAEINVAQIQADAQKVIAAFDSISSTIGSTGDVLDLTGGTNVQVIYNQLDPTWNGTTSESGTATYRNAANQNVTVQFSQIERVVVCFAASTMIDTAEGEVAIENLQVGDLVRTADHDYQPIRWIGSSKVAATGSVAPILIKAGALGNTRDLKVSPQHRMLLGGWQAEMLFGDDEVLVAAKHLVNDSTILRVEGGEVEYFHMLFNTHEIVFAEGAPSESFHPGEIGWGALAEEARAEILALFPELASGDFAGYGTSARRTLKAYEAALAAKLAAAE
jgi:hypothetical protein